MHSSKIVLALTVGLYAGSAISAVLATRRLKDTPVEGNLKEHAAAYAPACILFTTATALLVITNVRDARRLDALHGAYTMTREALEDLRMVLPAKELASAESNILQKKVDAEFQIPVDSEFLIHPNANCLDSTTGQSFVASVEKIHKVCQDLNYQIINGMFATMDDYCDGLGLEHISGGGQIGWNEGKITFSITTRLKDESIPVVVVSVSPLPDLMF